MIGQSIWMSLLICYLAITLEDSNTGGTIKIGKPKFPLGAFFNYVDKILSFFDNLPPYVDIFFITYNYKS